LARDGRDERAKKYPRTDRSLLAGRLKRLNVDRVVPATELDKCSAIGRGPNRLDVHPVDELKEEAVVTGGHDEEACGLVGGVAVCVDSAGRDEKEVAAMSCGPFTVAKDIDGAFEDVKALGHVLVEVRGSSGETGRDAKFDYGGAVACVVEGGVDVDSSPKYSEATAIRGCS